MISSIFLKCKIFSFELRGPDYLSFESCVCYYLTRRCLLLKVLLQYIKHLIWFKWRVLWRVLWIRFRKDAMVRMLRLTDAFIWEDLPTTDRVTGSLTMAAWIPRIQRFTTIFIISAITFHVAQSTVRVSISDDPSFVFGTGYPFDQKKSPAFELINLSQVKCL